VTDAQAALIAAAILATTGQSGGLEQDFTFSLSLLDRAARR
jgi:hypothetical protein